jgi:DNA-binding NarL/FixJ family response regulator
VEQKASSEKALRVVIADDQDLVRGGFRMILEANAIVVVGEAADGDQAVAAARRTRPDLVLLDIRMPGLDGLEAARRILALESPPKVVMLTTFDLDEYVYAALSAGASGFLLKNVSPETLVSSLRMIAAGDALLAPSVTRRLVERFARRDAMSAELASAITTLTEREMTVLRLLGRGLSNAELASQLYVSEATIKTHVAHVLAKLGLRDRVQAALLAYEHRLVEADR